MHHHHQHPPASRVLQVSVSDLCPATWYHFRLRVLYSGGEVLSEVTSVATQCDVPDAPERVKAVVDKVRW